MDNDFFEGENYMDKHFTEIKMYQCNYCGKVFFTNRRHKCKYNPFCKNCFSCKHCVSIEVCNLENENALGDTCEKVIDCENGIYVKVQDLSRKRWNLNCESWICMDNYSGKDTYVENVVWGNNNCIDTRY